MQGEHHRRLHRVPGLGLTLDVHSRNELCFVSLVTTESSLFLVHEGEMKVETGDITLVACQGEFLLLQSGEALKITHLPSDNGHHQAKGLLLDRTLVAEAIPSPEMCFSAPALLLGKRDGHFLDGFSSAYNALQETDRLPPSIVAHRLREPLMWLGLESVFFRPAENLSLSSRLRDLLSTSPGDVWPEKNAAKALGRSPATLRRHLAMEATSFRKILAETRMLHALRLLHSTDEPIGSIARSSGYSCQSRFALCFRKRFGFHPSVIRGHRRESVSVPETMTQGEHTGAVTE